MKMVIYFIAMNITFSFVLHGAEIVLNPGSKITIDASTRTTISCAGQLEGSSSKSCVILKEGEKDQYGEECIVYSPNDRYCGFFYKYGIKVLRVTTFEVEPIVKWCDRQLAVH